jgi:predicted nucleotidyltransferase
MRKIKLIRDLGEFNLTDFSPALRRLAEDRQLDLLYFFGGAVQGKSGKLSDIDMAYYSSREVDPLTLQNDFAHLLKRDDIDLVDIKFAPPLVAFNVIKEGQLIYCRNEALRVQMEYGVTFKYLNTIHLREEFHRHFIKTIKTGNFYA